MKELNVSSAVGTGWEVAKRHGLIIAAIVLIADIIGGILSSAFGADLTPSDLQDISQQVKIDPAGAMRQLFGIIYTGGAIFGNIISAIISITVTLGLYNLALALIKGQCYNVGFDAFRLPLMTYVKFIVTEIIVGILQAISLICCVIPFFFVAPRLAFAGLYIVENPEAGVIEAISASWNLTSASTLKMIGLFFIFIGMALLGVLCCCIGVYFAEAVIILVTTAAYLQLRADNETY